MTILRILACADLNGRDSGRVGWAISDLRPDWILVLATCCLSRGYGTHGTAWRPGENPGGSMGAPSSAPSPRPPWSGTMRQEDSLARRSADSPMAWRAGSCAWRAWVHGPRPTPHPERLRELRPGPVEPGRLPDPRNRCACGHNPWRSQLAVKQQWHTQMTCSKGFGDPMGQCRGGAPSNTHQTPKGRAVRPRRERIS